MAGGFASLWSWGRCKKGWEGKGVERACVLELQTGVRSAHLKGTKQWGLWELKISEPWKGCIVLFLSSTVLRVVGVSNYVWFLGVVFLSCSAFGWSFPRIVEKSYVVEHFSWWWGTPRKSRNLPVVNGVNKKGPWLFSVYRGSIGCFQK